MPAGIVQGDYGALANMATSLVQQADAVASLTHVVERYVDELQAGGWIGLGADMFFTEMRDLVFPGMTRLQSALSDASTAVERISAVFHEAEEEACRCFDGDGEGVGAQPSGADAAAEGFLGPAGKQGKQGVGVVVNPNRYTDGQNGWQLVHMGVLFEPGELVAQKDSTCALYAPINMMIMNGYVVSQAQADKVVRGILGDNWWRPDLWSDNDPNWGFDWDATEEVLKKFDVNYTKDSFPVSDKYMDRVMPVAEKFLIRNVSEGRPVLVATETDDIFGGKNGGHAYNVMGVQTDAQGRLKNVLVASNWAGAEFYEVPGRVFMNEWMRYRMWGDYGGSYMVLTPPEPED